MVGEIYDEDDEDDFVFAEDSITLQDDGTFLIRGDADLEDVDAVLGLNLDEEEVLKEFGTLSGFLCFCAGEIPKEGDFVMSRGWNFEVIEVDSKRIFQLRVERLLGFFEGEEGEDEDDNSVLGFFRTELSSRNDNDEESAAEIEANGDVSGVGDDDEALLAAVEAASLHGITLAEAVSQQAQVSSTKEASRVERLVEQNEMKAAEIMSEKQSVE